MGVMACLRAVFNVLLIMCVSCCESFEFKSRWRTETTLKSQLMSDYDMSALPPPSTFPTVVGISVLLLNVNVNEKEEVLSADAWLISEWNDPRLTWDPHTYMNISYVDLHHASIWKPDISVYNSPSSGAFHDIGEHLANVSHTGRVHFVTGVQFKYFCVVDLTYWPHDTHNCTLEMGSWKYNQAGIDLQLMGEKPMMESVTRVNSDGTSLSRGWWRLVSSSMMRHEAHFECCREPFISIRMSLILARDAPVYQWTVKMPVVALCILTFTLFLLPPCAEEKLIFGGLCLILDALFIAYSSVTVSHSHSHTPLIVKLVSQQFLLTVASVVVTAITTRLARVPHATPLSSRVITCLHVISGCLCLNNYRSLILPSRWQALRSYNASLKTDEVELGENGRVQLFNTSTTASTTSSASSNHHHNNHNSTTSSTPPAAPSSSSHRRPPPDYAGLDYLLMAATIDRLFLVIYIFIFIVNMLAYRSVL